MNKRFCEAALLLRTSVARLAGLAWLTLLSACPVASLAAEPVVNRWVAAEAVYELPAGIADAGWSTSDGFCGSTYRAVDGTILFRSGVHSKSHALSPGFYSNATLAWDLQTNKVRVVEIARWSGGSYGHGKLHDDFAESPTPTPRHTYDGLTWVAGEDVMYLMLGAYGRMKSNMTDEASQKQFAVDNLSTWKYLFKKQRWERIDHNVRKLWPNRRLSSYESHLQHWPAGERLLFLSDRARHYAEFDLKSQSWAEHATKNECPMSLYNARSAWDSQRNLWIFRLGPKLCAFDPSEREFHEIADAYEMPAEKDPRRTWKGVVYLPKQDVYLITGPTGNDTHVYDPTRQAWSNLPAGDIELANGYPQYDPRTGLVGLVYQHKTYTLRYASPK